MLFKLLDTVYLCSCYVSLNITQAFIVWSVQLCNINYQQYDFEWNLFFFLYTEGNVHSCYSRVNVYTICCRGIYKSFAFFFLQNFCQNQTFRMCQIMEYMHAFRLILKFGFPKNKLLLQIMNFLDELFRNEIRVF